MRKLVMLMAAMVAAVCAMAQGSFYVVMKDGSAEKFPVEKVDSLTFDNIDAEKVLGMGDLMKVVDGLKGELDSLKGENDALKKANEGNAAVLDSLNEASAKNADAMMSELDSLKGENDALKEANFKNAIIGDWYRVKAVIDGEEQEFYESTIYFTERLANGCEYELNGNTLTWKGGKPKVITTIFSVNKVTRDSLIATKILNGGKPSIEYYTRYDKAHDALEKKIAKLEKLSSRIDSLNEATARLTFRSTMSLNNSLAHSVVDLGLPSGTLWATYNVGATKPEEYGDYFAWGCTEETEDSKKWDKVKKSELLSQGVIDSDGNLTAEYDAATENWGDEWRMPTKEEIEELVTLPGKKVTRNGVSGLLLTGPNGNTLFLPCTGYKDNVTYSSEKWQGKGADVRCWSASSDDLAVSGEIAYSMLSYEADSDLRLNKYLDRYMRMPVRPVLKK